MDIIIYNTLAMDKLLVKVITKTPVRVHLIANLHDCEGRNLMLILVTPPIYASSEDLIMLKREIR